MARGWRDAVLDVEKCFEAAAQVTGEWHYTRAEPHEDLCQNVQRRLRPVAVEERRVPLRLHSLAQILNPQPEATDVIHALLHWIHTSDAAHQAGPSLTLPIPGMAITPHAAWLSSLFLGLSPCNVCKITSDFVIQCQVRSIWLCTTCAMWMQ